MIKKSKKAQASVEFLSMVGLMIAIFMGLVVLSGSQSRSASDVAMKLEMQEKCNEFATALNLAYTGGSGFITYVNLPEKIKRENYSISISNKTAYATSGEGLNSKVVFCQLLTSKINGTAKKGKMTLKNINGTIYIK